MIQPFFSLVEPFAPMAVNADSRRRIDPHPYSTAHYPAVRLVRQATPPEGLSYALISFWEERCPGSVQRTTIEKALTIGWLPKSNGAALLRYAAAPPVLRKPDHSALEKVLLLLARLYQLLEIDVAPSGQLLALRNHAEVLHNWASVREELIERSGGEDDITRILLESVGTQLQEPESLLASLQFDYAFGFLLPDIYQQRFESGFRYEQAQRFPQFFADTDVWFREHLELAEPVAAGRTTLRVYGTLDPIRTDLTVVAQQVDAALAARTPATAPPAPTSPEALRGNYEATFDLDLATGWPVAVEASVRCGAGEAYRKEYFVRLEQRQML